MSSNEAAQLNRKRYVEPEPMEDRVTRIEAHLEHAQKDIADMKLDLRDLRGDVKAANDSIAQLKSDVGTINATVPHLATKADLKAVEGNLSSQISALGAQINAMEAKIIKWIIFTAIGATGLAISTATGLAVLIARLLR